MNRSEKEHISFCFRRESEEKLPEERKRGGKKIQCKLVIVTKIFVKTKLVKNIRHEQTVLEETQKKSDFLLGMGKKH